MSINGRLAGRAAVVTGGGSGIGQATARRFAAEGAAVGVLDQDEALAREVADAITGEGGVGWALTADVSDPHAMRNAMAELVERTGRLDIVFANAGINGVWAPIDELQPDEWDRTIRVNLRGTYVTFHVTTPYLRRQGGVALITSSLQGTRVFSVEGSTAYACTKAAQVAFARKMALELARDRVRVNVICPGSTDTRINQTLTKREIERIRLPVQFPRGKVPLTDGRKVAADDAARLALFLASDDAAMITGAEVFIDGGMSLMMG
jgi:NAD(P)-dependent dehydrogenase (short-subunit alcohol dehydrogenase family)